MTEANLYSVLGRTHDSGHPTIVSTLSQSEGVEIRVLKLAILQETSDPCASSALLVFGCHCAL